RGHRERVSTMRHKCLLVLSLLVTLVVVFGSASARAQEACPPNFIPPPVDSQKPINSQDPINVGWLKAQLKLYYRCGYARDLDAALGEAKRYIEQRMSETPKPKNPAIVLDIDDTALSNWNVLWQDDLAYFSDGPCEMKPNTGCGWHAWELMAQASA